MKPLETYKRPDGWSSSILTVSFLVAILTISGLPAYAQNTEDALEEIVVKGYRGSLVSSLNLKRSAIGIVDGIVAEDIADFPDLNIGEALQRITGVTLSRSDNGEGNRISVRGLPSDFVRTTLNGITAASAGSDGESAVRSFDFDIFASELFFQNRCPENHLCGHD